MAIDFPASPSLNDTFASGGVTYTWDGTVWAASGSAAFALKAGDTFTGNVEISADLTVDTDTLYVDSANGKVGIGRTPTALFDVDVNGTALHIGFGANFDNYFTCGTGGDQIFRAGTNERMRIDSSGRVGIGTASPSTKLHIVGSDNNFITLDHSGRTGSWRIEHSGTNSERLAFIQDNGTSAVDSYRAGRDDHIFYTAGSERMRIDSSGRLLIGTTSWSGDEGLVIHDNPSSSGPGYLALATGDATPANNINLGAVTYNASNGGIFAAIRAKRDGGTWANGSSTPTRLEFSTTADGASSPTERMRIESDGDFRLGSASNYAIIRPWEATTGNLIIGTDQSATGSGGSATIFRNRGTESMRIDSAGRLLVGTSSSINNLFAGGVQIAGTSSDSYLTLTRYSTSASSGSGIVLGRSRSGTKGTNTAVANNDILGAVSFSGTDGTNFRHAAQIIAAVDGTVSGGGAADMPGRLVFSTSADGSASPVERMRITAAGQIIASTETNHVIASERASSSTDTLITFRHSATSLTSTGTNAFIIRTNGDATNINNSYGAISDAKLKENIVDASSQWDDIKALRPVNYNFKEGQTHTQLGLIAQEVELVSPGLVSESPDRDEEGNDLGTVTKSVNYSVLYMKSVKALQEAMDRIEVLEQRLEDAGL